MGIRDILTRLMSVAVDKCNLFQLLTLDCRKTMTGIIFSVSNSDTDWETRTSKYIIRADHRSRQTTLLVGNKISRGRRCDFDQLIVRPEMFTNSIITASVAERCSRVSSAYMLTFGCNDGRLKQQILVSKLRGTASGSSARENQRGDQGHSCQVPL